MRILVTYLSWTGNTRKVAEAVRDGLPDETQLCDYREAGDVSSYDLVFVGFPIHDIGQPAVEAREFLARRCAGVRVALLVTHCAVEEYDGVPQWLEACRSAAAGTRLVGVFHCQGEISPVQVEYLRNSGDPTLQDWARKAAGSKGQPDAARLEKARAFARQVLDETLRPAVAAAAPASQGA